MTARERHFRPETWAILLCTGLFLAACGGGDKKSTNASPAAPPAGAAQMPAEPAQPLVQPNTQTPQPAPAPKPFGVPVREDTGSPGGDLFASECGMCHRGFSTGVIMLERRLGTEMSVIEDRTDLQPEYIRRVVRTGIMNMPPFSHVEVTDEELDQIIDYLTEHNEGTK